MWLDIFHGTHTRHSMPGRGTMLHRTCLPRTGFTCGLQRVIQLLVQSGDPEDVFLMIHDDILPAHIFFWGFLFVSLVPIGKLRLTILGYVCAAPLMLDWPLRIDQHFDTLCTEIYVYTVDVYKDYIDTCSRPWCIIHPKASPRSANSAERIVIATKKGFHVGQVVQLCMAAVAQKYKIEWLGQKNGYPTE